METIHFTTHINAPREKVWDIMLGKETYNQWTKAFDPGSQYIGSWEEGAAIQFVGEDSQMGMASKIKENRKSEFVSIEHIGIVKDGVIDTTSDDAKKWSPSFENYTFKEVDGGTELSVSIDVMPEYKEMFEEMWPRALILLKELAEK
jgi:uncharacterized protein YndB with AHSA1/START domain